MKKKKKNGKSKKMPVDQRKSMMKFLRYMGESYSPDATMRELNAIYLKSPNKHRIRCGGKSKKSVDIYTKGKRSPGHFGG